MVNRPAIGVMFKKVSFVNLPIFHILYGSGLLPCSIWYMQLASGGISF